MRKLATADVFAVARVLKASGVRNDLVAVVQKLKSQTGEIDLQRVGIDTVFMVIEALAEKKAEAAIYEALAPILEVNADEVGQMPLEDLITSLKQIAEENDLANFFNSVFGTAGKN